MITGNKVIVAGEITTNAQIDIEKIVRETLKEIGYNDEKNMMDYRKCEIEQYIKHQSSDIANKIPPFHLQLYIFYILINLYVHLSHTPFYMHHNRFCAIYIIN